MTVKRGSLVDASKIRGSLREVGGKPLETEQSERVPTGTKSRAGKGQISYFASLEAITQIHILRAERRMTLQDIMKEAMNDLFIKHGKNPIA